MPTYEYRCENQHHFEEFQSMVAPPIEVCPVCGGKAERLISGGSGLIFKGSGFYITDYAKNKGGASSKTDVSSKPTASESKTESKSTKEKSGD